MKNIVIIDTFPSNKIQEDILIQCIEKLKPLGYDTMLVSHYPVNSDIQRLVNYYIFDDKNDFLPSHLSPFYFMYTDSFDVKVYNGGHALAITRNMSRSINFAKSMGYEYFVFMEFDILFHENDLKVLDGLRQQMVDENKKMVFFKPIDFIECGSHVYETLLFGGYCDFFLDKLQPPIDVDDWLNKKMGYTLEVAFFEKFSEFENQYIILPDHSHNYFAESKVNVFRYGLFICELLDNETNENQPCLFIHNSHVSPNEKFVRIWHGDTLIIDGKIGKSEWRLHYLTYDNNLINISIFESEMDYLNQENVTNKRFILKKENINLYRNKGNIKFKN